VDATERRLLEERAARLVEGRGSVRPAPAHCHDRADRDDHDERKSRRAEDREQLPVGAAVARRRSGFPLGT
jgi:hypothetical protein